MRIYDLRETGVTPMLRGQIYAINDYDRSDGYELSFLLDSGYDVRITQKEMEFALKLKNMKKKGEVASE